MGQEAEREDLPTSHTGFPAGLDDLGRLRRGGRPELSSRARWQVSAVTEVEFSRFEMQLGR